MTPLLQTDRGLAVFADRVQTTCGLRLADGEDGTFGSNKVFVHAAWKSYQSSPFPGLETPTLDAFKGAVRRAAQACLLEVSRADLVEAMNPADVAAGFTPWNPNGGERDWNNGFHFIRINPDDF